MDKTERYPDRKKYKLFLDFGKFRIVLRFKQASYGQTLEYKEILVRSRDNMRLLFDYWLEFLWKHTNFFGKIKIWLFKRTIYNNLLKIINEISQYYHRIRESVFRNIKDDAIDKYIFDNSYFIIAKETNIPIDEIENRLTFEQVSYILDKKRREFNEYDDKGKQINNKIWAEKNREMFEAVKNLVLADKLSNGTGDSNINKDTSDSG